MKRSIRKYGFLQLLSAAILITALAWFTVSSPFVYAGQQELARQHKMEKSAYPLTAGEEETTNSPGNNAEEKTSGNNTLSEEFIHEHHIATPFQGKVSLYHKSKNANTYIAFHGELLVPPPNRL
jgi:hypothetical protein